MSRHSEALGAPGKEVPRFTVEAVVRLLPSWLPRGPAQILANCIGAIMWMFDIRVSAWVPITGLLNTLRPHLFSLDRSARLQRRT